MPTFFFDMTLRPISESIAGVRVTEINTATKTHSCRRIAHVSQEGNTCHVQGKQGDNHGCSGEENRVPTGAVSDRDRFPQRHAVHQVRPVPVENEQ